MKQTYKITGMSCNGCRTNAENTLNNIKGITKATVILEDGKAEVEFEHPISLEKLNKEFLKAGLHYTISDFNSDISQEKTAKPIKIKPINGNGVFYCPMHCEGDKTYEKPVDCPVCGMDLVEQPKLVNVLKYTCPMHPEIIKDKPGNCPICGMALVKKGEGANVNDDD